MCDCREKSNYVLKRLHRIDCNQPATQTDESQTHESQTDKSRLDRSETMLKYCQDETSPESMANQPNPLQHAIELTYEIKYLKKRNIEVKSELKSFLRRTKQFTVGLLDECKDSKDVDAVLNPDGKSDSDDLACKIEMLRKAVDAKHKKVYHTAFTSAGKILLTNSLNSIAKVGLISCWSILVNI